MIRFQRATWSLLAGALVLGACSDPLEVKNVDNPDIAAVLRTPRDVETLAGRLYQNVHSSTVTVLTATNAASNNGIYPQMLTLGLENASQLNNFGMGPRASIPRQAIDNARGNSLQVEHLRNFQRGQNSAQTAAAVLERIADSAFTIGSAAQNARVRSFAHFALGTALGNVALTYDSAAIARPGLRDSTPPLVGYQDVMAAALANLDTAQSIAESSVFTLSLPSTWLAQSADMPKANYIRVIRSYKARFRAQVARDTTERRAANWTQIIADATNGIAGDFTLQLNPGTGWDYVWLASHFTTGSGAWHTMTPYIIGMADTTVTRYNSWLATARDDRQPFLINTPDRRFPPGDTRAAQLAASTLAATANGQYFRNRPPGEDVVGASWGNSFYEHYRWRALFDAQRIGTWVTFSKAENDMYAAEGHIRAGNLAAAAALINASRTQARVGLPAIPATITRNAGVPDAAGGSAGCVPRVPDPAQAYIATKCGDIFEAMKWESRMESAYAAYGAWYLNGRGWGDLPEGTAVNWPVPFQEADARNIPFKNLGGVGQPGGAPASVSYGFGSGNR
jgi:hypothetical protein